MSELSRKINEAKDRIREFLSVHLPDQVYVAVSGGKDSRAVLSLCRQVYPNILVIHNGHPGEKVDGIEGVLHVTEPKAENVPKFLSCVNLCGQIDGTRRDEDKTVIFDGQEIHRSVMPGNMTKNGVFGLGVLFPIYDWTDEDVLAYLADLVDPVFDGVKVSFEGEGNLIGLKTLYCQYPGTEDKVRADDLLYSTQSRGVDALYIVAERITEGLMDWVRQVELPITIDTAVEEACEFPEYVLYRADCQHIQWFLRCRDYESVSRELSDILEDGDVFNGFLKMECKDFADWEGMIEDANLLGSDGYEVLLMPMWGGVSPIDIGREMMASIDKVGKNVRVMPPVHPLLGIP